MEVKFDGRSKNYLEKKKLKTEKIHISLLINNIANENKKNQPLSSSMRKKTIKLTSEASPWNYEQNKKIIYTKSLKHIGKIYKLLSILSNSVTECTDQKNHFKHFHQTLHCPHQSSFGLRFY